MKKLLIAMMSVASLAFISKAEAINSGTTFENYSGAFNADKDDHGLTDGTFWHTAGLPTECGTLTNIDYTASYNVEQHGRPAIAQGAATATALAVEAEQRLERGIANYSGGFAPQDIGSGIYFDTMVQFTATDIAPTPSQDDKLIVWLYGSADEDSAFSIGTNLMVTAGYLSDSSNTAVPSNYVVTTASAIEPNTWHRLTIKSIKSITTDGSKVAGFVVFIDGVAVATEEAKGVEGSAMTSLNATAGKWNNTNNLFPSLVTKKDSAESLSAVALEGTGMIDDISFTSTAPAFAADAPTVVISWGDGVDSVQYKVGSGSFVDVVNGATITLESAGTITVAANYANGYVADAWLFNGAETTETSFNVNAPSTIEIAAKQQLITAGGETFASVEALVAWLNSEAQSGFTGTIKLLGNVNVGKTSEGGPNEILMIPAGQNVTLDLAGHNLCGTNAATQAAVATMGGTLTIINSTPTIGHISMVSDEDSLTFAVYAADGTINITAGFIDGAVVVGDYDEDGTPGVINLTGGSYVAADGKTETFYLADYVSTGYTASYADNYWNVTSGESPDPGQIPFTKSETIANDLATAIAYLKNNYYNKYTNGDKVDAPDASYVKVGTLASEVTGTVSIGGTVADAGEKFSLSIGNNAFLESAKFKIVDGNVYVAAVILAIEQVKVTANETDYPIDSANSGNLELKEFKAVAPTTIAGEGTNFTIVRGDDKPLVKFFFTDTVTQYFVTKKTFIGKDKVATTSYGFTTPDEGGLWLYLGYGVGLGGNWNGATYNYTVYAFGVDKKAITLSMSITDKALVPTTDDGTVAVTGEGVNAVAVITPTEGKTSVTVNVPDAYIGKIQVPASVDTVSGVTLEKLLVAANAPYGGTTVDISAAFKATLAANGSITIALDPAASVQVGGETIAVRPVIVEAVDASIADGSVAAKTIPGLYYQLVRWSSLAADKTVTETVVVDRTLATGTTLKLTDPNKPANSAFYIIRVEK